MKSPIFITGRPLLHHRKHYYPDDRVEVNELVHIALQNVERTQDVNCRILIIPNGCYRTCGRIMAAAYAQLCPEPIKRIFIFGRTEKFMPYMGSLTDTDFLQTPLGKIAVDKDVNAEILKSGDFSYFDLPTDAKERFVEMQLPFIAKVMEKCKGFYKVIPIYVGTLSHDQVMVMANRFVKYLKDPSNAFIFSASLCHWGEIYGYDKRLEDTPTVLDSIKKVDGLAMEALQLLKPKVFDDFLLDSKAHVPDNQIISLCLHLVRQFLIANVYDIIKLDEQKKMEAMRLIATFKLMGQAWSFPDVQPPDSCISFFSGVIRLDEEKYIPEEPAEPDPLSKHC